MRAFKTKAFAKWASAEGLDDNTLAFTVTEINRGLIDASLGGHVVKKRVALWGRGKRGGTRTLVAFKQDDRAFFIYGYAKNEQANISDRALRVLKLLAKELLNYSVLAPAKAAETGELIEIEVNDDG